MKRYYTVWFIKDLEHYKFETIYSDMEFNKQADASKYADKNLKFYNEAIVQEVTETERRKSYKMVESIFNNK